MVKTLVAARSRVGVRVWFVLLGVLSALCSAAALALFAGTAEAATPAVSVGGSPLGYKLFLAQFDPVSLGTTILEAVVVFIAIGAILGAAAWAFKRSIMAAVSIVIIGAVLMAFAADYQNLTEVGDWFIQGGGLGGGGGN